MFFIPFHLQVIKTSENCFSAFNCTLGGWYMGSPCNGGNSRSSGVLFLSV